MMPEAERITRQADIRHHWHLHERLSRCRTADDVRKSVPVYLIDPRD